MVTLMACLFSSSQPNLLKFGLSFCSFSYLLRMSYVASVIEYFVNNPSILATIFLLYVFVFVLSLLLVRPPPGKNPFRFDSRKDPKPLVTDEKVRDSVLKQGKF